MAAVLLIVEGPSDQIALEALAARRGIALARAGVEVVSLGGAHRIGRFLAGRSLQERVALLCDAGEEPVFRAALERAGIEEPTGLHVCVADLEDELIRALGLD